MAHPGQFKKGHQQIASGRGKAYAWLAEHVSHCGDECLIWAFNRRANGYGALGYKGKIYYAHRMMCELANGPPPTPDHEASHSCGRGHEGCVHPKHLSWKTASENHLDRRRHGTHVTNRTGSAPRITKEQKREIQALEGKMTQVDIGAIYGVPFQTISRIFREDLDRPMKHRSFDETENAYIIDAYNRGARFSEMAKHLDRTQPSIDGHISRLHRIGALQVRPRRG
jgi:hypothetical protein